MNLSPFTIKYLDILRGKFAGLNLTAIKDPEEFEVKQLEDSIVPLTHSEIFKQKIFEHGLVIDLGFGGGFPILPLAQELPDVQFIGIDSKAKKVKAVDEIAQDLALYNTRFCHSRIEDIQFDVPAVITIKAVGKINFMLEKIYATCPVDIFFYKAKNYKEEILDGVLDPWQKIEQKEYSLSNHEMRSLIGFSNVPRGTSTGLAFAKGISSNNKNRKLKPISSILN